jgi:hypothetical protein
LHWGTFELVELFTEMMRTAVGPLGCSYVVLLSGQDYPVRSVLDLDSALAKFDVWAEVKPLLYEGAWTWPEAVRRYSYRWWHTTSPGLPLRKLDRLATVMGIKWSSRQPPLRRLVHFWQGDQLWWGWRDRTGPGVPIYAGSSWMSLSRPAVAAILAAPRRVTSFFRHVPIPDEACFQTILCNAPGLRFAPGNGRFIRWGQAVKEHPDILTVDDLAAIVASGAHFARKFDADIDSEVLDLLDASLDDAERS